MTGKVTRIRLGWTDGGRYVGVQPSLTDDETSRVIALRPGFGQGNVEQIPGANACSLVGITNFVDIERGNEAARQLAAEVAGALAFTRSPVDVDTTSIVQLEGAGSSPFEPATGK